jgi:small subunit ribosomal protein S8
MVEIPHSKLKEELVKLFLQEGYIRGYELREDNRRHFKTLRVLLKYDMRGYPVFRKIQRVSRPGLRKYAGSDKMPRILGGAGIAVVSTNQGLKTDRTCRRERLGGEVLCYVY